MLLTSNSDIFVRFQESAFNTILNEVLLQRPSLFNYGTTRVISENRFCKPIQVNPILDAMGVPKSTEVDSIPIIVPGETNSTGGVDFCVQLRELKLDFSPTSAINLPPELGNLVLQEFALTGTVCAGIGCGDFNFKPTKVDKIVRPVGNKKAKKISTGLSFSPLNLLTMHCFCLSLFGKAVVINDGNNLKLKLVGIELEDIKPLGLENSIECYLKQMLDQGVFPNMKIALEELSLNVSSYFNIRPTPTSTVVPYNPNVSNNYLSIFLNAN